MSASSDLFSLQDRHIAVTGASRGLGRGLAVGLAQAGAHLALLARSQQALAEVKAAVEGHGRQALAVAVDVTDPQQVERAFTDVAHQFPQLDVLVNNAGINIRTPARELADADWQAILRTNLDGAFYCARSAAALMPAGGSIINIGSVAGLVAIPTGAAYAASKAGLAQLTRSLAQEWGPQGIRVNCLAPWYFRTPLTEKLLDNPATLQRILRVTPLGRIGQADDLLGAVTFLATTASAYVTGQTLAVDGGMSTTAFHA